MHRNQETKGHGDMTAKRSTQAMDLDSDQTSPEETATFIGEAQLLLAEKRTSLATLRTGIAMLALPLSVVSLLVATSRLYTFSQVAYLALPLLAFCGLLVCVGAYLVGRSIHNIRRMDRHLRDLKRRSPTLAELID